MKPVLRPPGSSFLKLIYDGTLAKFAFKFNLRRYTMCLAFVFMFGNSIRQLFESVIFIFVVHPFDVGDDVIIAGERQGV